MTQIYPARTRILKTCSITLFCLAGCQSVQTTQPGVVGVGRPQQMLISSSEIAQASEKQYAEVISKARQEGVLNKNSAQVARVRSITERLIRQTTVLRPDAQAWKWEINVLDSSEVNAWCMPGGKIAVYTGLIDKLRVTDDELAAVIGHEIAHALREHARERASQQAVAGLGIQVISTVAGVGALGTKGMEYAYMGLLGLPNSRNHEVEADRLGVELAARAGYDPRAAVTLWQKMGQAGGGELPKFLSTHPSSADRQRDLTDYAERVMPLYKK
ncbi:MAG: M48 family metallopeptidase [Pseudomonadota bacterium]